MENKTFYEILNVSESASSKEITAAFRLLALTHHPDSGGEHESFLLINNAYKTLTDPVLRANYDRTLSIQSTKQSVTNEYEEHFFDETSSKVILIIRNTKYAQISGALIAEVNSHLEVLRTKIPKDEFLQFSSSIATLLINKIIHAVNNNMIQNFHAYINIDNEGIMEAYQKLKLIEYLSMSEATKKNHSKNKKDLKSILYNCFNKNILLITKISALILIVFYVFFSIYLLHGTWEMQSALFFTIFVYFIFYYVILLITKFINQIYINLKLKFIF